MAQAGGRRLTFVRFGVGQDERLQAVMFAAHPLRQLVRTLGKVGTDSVSAAPAEAA